MLHLQIKSVASLAALWVALAATSAQALITPNLLTDPGFNTPLTNPLISYTSVLGPPYNVDAWGDENSSVVGAQAGVTPLEGNGMLRMDDDGLVVTQIWQRVNVNLYITDIDAGNAMAMSMASFNTPGGVLGASGAVQIAFYNAANAFLGSFTQPTGALDPNPQTWQGFATPNVAVPVGTRFLETQLYFVNSTLPSGTGGYVDAVDMRLKTIPEPASCLMVVFGACTALLRRARG